MFPIHISIDPKLVSFVLMASGALFLFTAIISGLKLKEKLPELLRNRWLLLILLMVLFFCGHLLFAYLLWYDFVFHHLLLATSIFFGGTFALLLVALTRATANTFLENESRLSRTSKILKLKNSRLSIEKKARINTEAELERTNTLYLKDLFEMMIEVLANRDQYTFEHVYHVAAISRTIGKELKLSDDQLEILELGCLVHDIGKTAIPDDVLLKPDHFDSQDRKIMDYHPLIGAKLISRHIHDDRITDIVLKHHERLDGSGYPLGIKGDDIDLLSRIVGVADIYDALVSQRPYKTPLSGAEALDILRKEADDGKLDKTVVTVLGRVVTSVEEIGAEQQVTAGFMRDVELFRSRSYFREPLTDFYNYRFLLSLDDARLLKTDRFSFYLFLIRFPDFNKLQLDIGYAVADQVLDEVGHNLLQATNTISHEREYYEGSVMMFRKGLDYLIYLERDKNEKEPGFLTTITSILDRAETEWHLVYTLNSLQFAPGTPVVQAICKLFDQTQKGRNACDAFPHGTSPERNSPVKGNRDSNSSHNPVL